MESVLRIAGTTVFARIGVKLWICGKHARTYTIPGLFGFARKKAQRGKNDLKIVRLLVVAKIGLSNHTLVLYICKVLIIHKYCYCLCKLPSILMEDVKGLEFKNLTA